MCQRVRSDLCCWAVSRRSVVVGFCVCAVCWSTPVYYFIRWRRQVTARLTDKVIAKAVQENNEVEMKDMKEGAHENKVVPGNGESVVSVPQQ